MAYPNIRRAAGHKECLKILVEGRASEAQTFEGKRRATNEGRRATNIATNEGHTKVPPSPTPPPL